MIEALYRSILRVRWLVLGGVVALTACMAYSARHLRVESTSTDLFPSNHPYVATFNKYSQRFGGANRLVIAVVVKDGTIFNTKTLQKIQNVQRAVELMSGVNKNQLLSIASRKAKTTFFGANGLSSTFVMWPDVPTREEGVQAVRKAVISNRFVHGVLVSLDEKSALVIADFFEHNFDPRRIYDEVQRLIARESDPNTSLHAIGRPILVGGVLAQSHELGRIMLVTGACMVFALWLAFRSLAGVVVPTVAALVSAAMGLGFLGLIGHGFEPLTLVIPFVITARALSHSAQMVSRFLDERERGREVTDAARGAAVALFKPGALAIMTDVAGISLISLAPIPLLRKLALMGAFWLASIVVSGMILSPVLLSMLPSLRRVRRDRSLVHQTLTHIGRICTGVRSRKIVMALAAFALAFAAVLARKLVIGDAHPGTSLLWPDSTYNRDTAEIARRFTNTEQLTVVLEGDSPEPLKRVPVSAAIEAFQRHMEELPEVGATSSIIDVVPAVVSLFHNEDPKWELLPDRNSELGFYLELLYTSGDPGDRDRFVTNDLKDASITVYLRDHKGNTLRRVVSHARAFVDSHPIEGAHFRLASGYGGLLAAINEKVAEFDARITLAAFAAMFLCCVLAFRSIAAGLLFLVPLVASNCMTYALMATAGIGLDVNALPVVALGIGLGVDYALYVVEEIRQRFRVVGGIETAMLQGVQGAGGGVLVTALTMAFGLVFWRFSFLRFQADMGMLLLFWLMTSMLGGLILVPCILMQVKPRFVFGGTARARRA